MPKDDIDWSEDVEFKKGRVMVFGRRHSIVDSGVFYSIREKMKKIVGSAADRMLYMAGKERSERFVKAAMEESRMASFISKFNWGEKKIIEKLADIFTQYGFGIAEVEEFTPDGRSSLIVKDSIIGTKYSGESDRPTCSYLAGYVAGGASVVFGEDMECHEEECVGKGDKFCRFVVEPAEE